VGKGGVKEGYNSNKSGKGKGEGGARELVLKGEDNSISLINNKLNFK
jgi:hypothetical protein